MYLWGVANDEALAGGEFQHPVELTARVVLVVQVGKFLFAICAVPHDAQPIAAAAETSLWALETWKKGC